MPSRRSRVHGSLSTEASTIALYGCQAMGGLPPLDPAGAAWANNGSVCPMRRHMNPFPFAAKLGLFFLATAAISCVGSQAGSTPRPTPMAVAVSAGGSASMKAPRDPPAAPLVPQGGAGSPAAEPSLRAVIIKAAGTTKQAGPDTLSTATTEPYNTHVFADVLAQHLRELGVRVAVVAWVDCAQVSCVQVPESGSTVPIVVFAGVTHNGNFPEELTSLVSTLAKTAPAPKVTSALTSCNKMPGVDSFMRTVVDAGLPSIPGIALRGPTGTTLADEDMHSALTSFANQLVTAAKNGK